MIHIEGEYYIGADGNQYILLTKTISKKGKEVIKYIGFYGTLASTFNAYLKMKQRQCISQSEYELLEAIKALKKERSKVASLLVRLETVEEEE